MKVKVQYLLWLAQKAGVSEEFVDVEENSTIAGLLEKLIKIKPPVLADVLKGVLEGRSDIIVLHNSRTPLKGLLTSLKDGDTVTLIPPVSGGSDLNL